MGLKKMNQKLLVLMPVLILVFIIVFGCYAQTGTRESWTTVGDAVDAVYSQMTAAVGSQAGTYEKALWLHDWLTDNAYYALDADGNPSSAEVHHSAEGVLLQGTGVCESYAKAYRLLLNNAGIPNEIVTGEAINPDGGRESHAWNLVNFDGTWAHTDVTWDDPIHKASPKKYPLSGDENHMYFGMNTALISRDHFDLTIEYPVSSVSLDSVTSLEYLYAKKSDYTLFESENEMISALEEAAGRKDTEINLYYVGADPNFETNPIFQNWYDSKKANYGFGYMEISFSSYTLTLTNIQYLDPGDAAAWIYDRDTVQVYSTLQDAFTDAAEGETVTILKNIDSSNAGGFPLRVGTGKNFTIDLNGHDIDRGQTTPVDQGHVLTVIGKLTLTDNTGSGVITGGNSTGGGGGIFVDTGGNLVIGDNVSITGNKASGGGGLYINNGTDLMSGGSIHRNTASNDGGGVHDNGSFEMKNGIISGNICLKNGGGVYFSTSFVMKGGSVTENSASYGGGVYGSGTLKVFGGSITDNIASSEGGGVYRLDSFEVSNGINITGNKKGSAESIMDNNVYLGDGAILQTYGLDNSARIGITTKTVPTIDNPVTFTDRLFYNSDLGDFTSDLSAYSIRQNSGGAAELYVPKVASISNGATTVYYASLKKALDAAADGDTVTILEKIEEEDADMAGSGGQRAITIDLNGFEVLFGTISMDGDLTIEDNSSEGGGSLTAEINNANVNNPDQLTVKDSAAVTFTGIQWCANQVAVQDTAVLTFRNSIFLGGGASEETDGPFTLNIVGTDAEVVLDNTSVDGYNRERVQTQMQQYAPGGETVVVNGSAIKQHGPEEPAEIYRYLQRQRRDRNGSCGSKQPLQGRRHG